MNGSYITQFVHPKNALSCLCCNFHTCPSLCWNVGSLPWTICHVFPKRQHRQITVYYFPLAWFVKRSAMVDYSNFFYCWMIKHLAPLVLILGFNWYPHFSVFVCSWPHLHWTYWYSAWLWWTDYVQTSHLSTEHFGNLSCFATFLANHSTLSFYL